MQVPTFVKDGFLCFNSPSIDIKLKLEADGKHQQALARMSKMDPAVWDVSYTLKHNDPEVVIVALSSVYGLLKLKTAPRHLLESNIMFGYDVARDFMTELDPTILIEIA